MLSAMYLCCFLGVVCAAWALVSQPSTPRLRLAGLPDSASAFPRIPGRRWTPLAGLLSVAGKLVPRFGARNSGVQDRLLYAGSRLTLKEFTGLKVLAAVGGAAAAAVVLREFDQVAPLWLALAGMAGFVLPDLWLRSRVARRQKAIVKLLPEVIDLLALCVGAGLDFFAAINKVLLAHAGKTREPLIEELSVAVQEFRLGRRRFEALQDMAKRVNLPEVSSFIRTLVQADRMGTPIASVLAIHSEDVRFERFTKAERAALKAPIKILIPLIFCIMPCVALIVGAPIFIQFMRQSPF